MDENERTARHIAQQVERGAKAEKHVRESEFTELKRDTDEDKGETIDGHNMLWVS